MVYTVLISLLFFFVKIKRKVLGNRFLCTFRSTLCTHMTYRPQLTSVRNVHPGIQVEQRSWPIELRQIDLLSPSGTFLNWDLKGVSLSCPRRHRSLHIHPQFHLFLTVTLRKGRYIITWSEGMRRWVRLLPFFPTRDSLSVLVWYENFLDSTTHFRPGNLNKEHPRCLIRVILFFDRR